MVKPVADQFGAPSLTPSTPTATNTPVAVGTTVLQPATSGTSFISGLQSQLADLNVASGLNADGTKITRTQQNTINKDAGPPSDAPAGYHYTWISSLTGGSWRLYKDSALGNTGTGLTGNGTNNTDTGTLGTPTTNVDVLKAMLKAQGFSSTVVDSSATFLDSLLKDGLDYDNAIQVYLNTKDYTLKNGTKITSPFYDQYGYLNEGLVNPKAPSELFNAVQGYKGLQQKYGFSDKYLSTESLKNYVKNNVTVADLDERANAARLAAINADPAKTDALMKLGYIANSAGLQDFYMDAKIGKEQLDLNRNTGAFVAEAIRRAKSGLISDAVQVENYKKIAADLSAKGYSEAQITQLASTGFQNIADTLQSEVALSGIYEKTAGNAATTSTIQSELQQEEFSNMASSRRKKLEEQNKKAFEGSAGLYSRLGQTGSLGTTSTGGIL